MSHDIIKIPIGTIEAIRAAFGEDGLPMPFTREIFLMKCHVAGTSYSKNIDIIAANLNINDLLVLRREPDNPYDQLAILVLDEAGRKVGYVPRKKNEVIARLMDAGKLVFGKIEEKQYLNRWLEINIRVYMRDF